jgi:hypothetical protein
MTKQEIKNIFSSHLNDAKAWREAIDDDKEKEAEELQPQPLEVSTTKVIKVLLSWGGPADGFDIYIDDKTEADLSDCVKKIVYVHEDWGTHDEYQLNDKEEDIIIDWLCSNITI